MAKLIDYTILYHIHVRVLYILYNIHFRVLYILCNISFCFLCNSVHLCVLYMISVLQQEIVCMMFSYMKRFAVNDVQLFIVLCHGMSFANNMKFICFFITNNLLNIRIS